MKVSMNGRGAWRDIVFVERFWWSLKFEEVYLRAYDTLWEARHSIGAYMNTYNSTRRHSKLDDMTPDSVYQKLLPAVPATPPTAGSRATKSADCKCVIDLKNQEDLSNP